MKKIIILFGAPGSGKGTLGDCIKAELIAQGKFSPQNLHYVSTGDLLRAEIASGSELGEKISSIVQAGGLVSDEIVEQLVCKALRELKDGNLMFLDGYPRTKAQLDALSTMLDENFYITTIKRNTDENVIKSRITKRRVCAVCKTTHTVDDGKCPKCGGPSTIRKDDSVIEKRLEEYHANTEPIWNYMALISKRVYTVNNNEEAADAAKRIVHKHF